MKPITALVIDDELIARKVLNHMLSQHPTVEVVGEAANLEQAVELANKHKPDLIFLDIQLPESQNGFSLLDHLSFQPHIVVVTAHDRYAVRAFELQALDYILKPVDPERLAQTIGRFPQAEHSQPDNTAKHRTDDLVLLRDCNQLYRVPRSTISAIVADSCFTHIHRTDESQSLFIRKGISEWEKELPSPPFVRLDRSIIINTDHILGLTVVHRDQSWLQMRGTNNRFQLRRVALNRLRRLSLPINSN